VLRLKREKNRVGRTLGGEHTDNQKDLREKKNVSEKIQKNPTLRLWEEKEQHPEGGGGADWRTESKKAHQPIHGRS